MSSFVPKKAGHWYWFIGRGFPQFPLIHKDPLVDSVNFLTQNLKGIFFALKKFIFYWTKKIWLWVFGFATLQKLNQNLWGVKSRCFLNRSFGFHSATDYFKKKVCGPWVAFVLCQVLWAGQPRACEARCESEIPENGKSSCEPWRPLFEVRCPPIQGAPLFGSCGTWFLGYRRRKKAHSLSENRWTTLWHCVLGRITEGVTGKQAVLRESTHRLALFFWTRGGGKKAWRNFKN